RAALSAVNSLNQCRLEAVVAIDSLARTATLQAGMRGPAAERALHARGLSLGHFPQSVDYATIGGYAATRSAGQASTGYGRFDELARGLRLVAPAGELDVAAVP